MMKIKDDINLIINNINTINELYDTLFVDEQIQFDNSFFRTNENEPDIFRDNNELLFLYSISFIYNLYHDRGQSNIDFIIGKMRGEQLNDSKQHKELINSLRTYFFHFLSNKRKNDNDKKRDVTFFYFEVCGQELPIDDEDWKKCVCKIIEEANTFLSNIILCIKNSDKLLLKKEWLSNKTRELPVQELKDSIKNYIIIYDIRIECNSYYQRIEKHLTKEFKQVSHNNLQYKQIMEHMDNFIGNLIEKRTEVPPLISGKDLLNRFDIEPGPKMKEMINYANRKHQESPCINTKEYYLDLVRDKFQLKPIKGK